MKIRDANNDDVLSIKNLVLSVMDEFGLQADQSCTDRDLEDIQSFYFDNQGYFAVAEESGRIVATMGLLRLDATSCELRKMYILPNYRRRGLGTQLLELALKKARQLGYRRVSLETGEPLKVAIALYKKYGFRQYTPTHMSARCDRAFELFLY